MTRYKTYGVRELRTKKGWSRLRFAGVAEVDRSTVYRAETGENISESSARAIAKGLGVSFEELTTPPPRPRLPADEDERFFFFICETALAQGDVPISEFVTLHEVIAFAQEHGETFEEEQADRITGILDTRLKWITKGPRGKLSIWPAHFLKHLSRHRPEELDAAEEAITRHVRQTPIATRRTFETDELAGVLGLNITVVDAIAHHIVSEKSASIDIRSRARRRFGFIPVGKREEWRSEHVPH